MLSLQRHGDTKKSLRSVYTLCGVGGKGKEICRVLRLCPLLFLLVTLGLGTLARSQWNGMMRAQ